MTPKKREGVIRIKFISKMSVFPEFEIYEKHGNLIIAY